MGTNLISEFIRKHPDAKSGLRRWQKLMEETSFGNIAELRKTFPTADAVEGKTVFNVGGNKVRTITEIQYGIAMVIITHVLTHAEYDKEKWKKD